MKKLIFSLILMVLPIKVFATASSSIVMDLNSNRIIYANNINEQRLIASITKIMTCIVAIEHGSLDDVYEVGDEVLTAYGSAIYIEMGEKLTLKDLLYGLMLRSGNDAAVVIAKNIAGNMDNFAMLMNETANKIGMKNSYFYNAHGLEESDGTGNLSTAYDMALLTKYAMQNDTFKEIFKTKNYQVKTNKKSYSWTNKNKLLHNYDFITGGKTGFTQKARRTLVTTASSNNIDLVIVTLNDPNDFNDHLNLYESTFRNYKALKVLDKNKFTIKNDTEYKEDTLYIKEDIYISILPKEEKDIKIEYELYKDNNYKTNDIVGKAKIYLKEDLLKEVDIYVTKKEDEVKLSWWQKLLRWLKW